MSEIKFIEMSYHVTSLWHYEFETQVLKSTSRPPVQDFFSHFSAINMCIDSVKAPDKALPKKLSTAQSSTCWVKSLNFIKIWFWNLCTQIFWCFMQWSCWLVSHTWTQQLCVCIHKHALTQIRDSSINLFLNLFVLCKQIFLFGNKYWKTKKQVAVWLKLKI